VGKQRHEGMEEASCPNAITNKTRERERKKRGLPKQRKSLKLEMSQGWAKTRPQEWAKGDEPASVSSAKKKKKQQGPRREKRQGLSKA